MRLIDADALMRKAVEALYTTNYFNHISKMIDDFPTVMGWIPVSEGLPEEHEWIGTKEFGTTISDTVLVTFDVVETRIVKPMRLQNGELSRADKNTMDAFYKGCKMIAWMPLPEPYKGEDND